MGRPIVPFVVSFTLPVIFALFRRWAPRNQSEERVLDDGRRLPYGAANGIMCVLGLVIAVGGFFLLRTANSLYGEYRQSSTMLIYPEQTIWVFLPGFAALSLPWIVTLKLLRRYGYEAQAAEIVAKGNAKMNYNGEKVMHLLAWGTVLPLAVGTLLAVPMHMAVDQHEVRVTHYAHLKPEIFRLVEARRAFWVEGYALRDGSFQSHPDLLIEFSDGRRLSANAVGDGGSVPSQELVDLLLRQTKLIAQTVRTENDIPALSPDAGT